MPNETIILIYYLMWYAIIALSIIYIISGLDNFFLDSYYWTRYLWRKHKMRRYQPLTYEKLLATEEQLIAVLVPCWREANVISTMLQHNCHAIDYKKYFFFIGVYPNDQETINAVQDIAHLNKHVKCIIGKQNGPTNKAANLNTIYTYIKAFEDEIKQSFSIFVLHDSEDVIHPLSFKLYNYLIPRKDMIQIPIFPREVNHWNFTHWLYADEFAENHTKDIVVRESIRAHVPSAGVGTAFRRGALQLLEDTETGEPFATNSLTEDYRTSLALRVRNLKQIFVTQHVVRMKWQKSGFFRRRYVQKPKKEIIAVRALFPLEYTKSVRQKARWIIGIVFQEWRDGIWPKEWVLRYTLSHDRKSFITHLANGFGYVVFIFWLFYSLFTYAQPEYPDLQEQFNFHPWAKWLCFLAAFQMIERLIQRTIATSRVYGLTAACLVIPRAIYGNILNLHALIRAYRIYFSKPKDGTSSKNPAWDKTDHSFPGLHPLVPFRKRLGDILVENHLINDEQLHEAMFKQQRSGERLGQILCRLNFITPSQLVKILSAQYNLPLLPHKELLALQNICIPKLSKKTARWLNKNRIIPIDVDNTNKKLTLVIEDPTNEDLIKKILNYFTAFETKFMLVDVD